MKVLSVCAAAALIAAAAGMARVAYADHVDNRNFSNRDVETEFYVCHTTGHLNDRFVYNEFDRDFCNDVLDGHVEFLTIEQAAEYVSRSRILCYQRSERCKFDEGAN